jgi:indole-3-glycerol phosphate synthase
MTAQPSVLDRILAHKRTELARQQIKIPLDAVQRRAAQAPSPRDFAAALQAGPHVALIAEVKKASPSKGVLRAHFDHLALARTYIEHGAAALSVLTDMRFFEGHLKHLEGIRTQASTAPPLLRKDFLFDPYQIYEARAYGADAVLLIVAVLDDTILGELLTLAASLGMATLVEVHTESELDRALAVGARVVGVNNRDLHTFHTTLDTTARIAARLPTGAERPVLVSESGILTAADVAQVHACGADAVLVGEALVTAPDTAARVRDLAGVPRKNPA